MLGPGRNFVVISVKGVAFADLFMCAIDRMLSASPGIIKTSAIIAHGSAGAQGNGLPDTHHISAGIPATKIRNPRMYPIAFLMRDWFLLSLITPTAVYSLSGCWPSWAFHMHSVIFMS